MEVIKLFFLVLIFSPVLTPYTYMYNHQYWPNSIYQQSGSRKLRVHFVSGQGLVGSTLIKFVFTLDPLCFSLRSAKAKPSSTCTIFSFLIVHVFYIWINEWMRNIHWHIVDSHNALRRIQRVDVSKTRSTVVLAEHLVCKLSASDPLHDWPVCSVQRDVALSVWIR